MKTLGSTLPIVILSLVLIGVWGLGLLAVKASATSTQVSIDLLRQHLKVARLHEQLLVHSKQSLELHAQELSATVSSVPRTDTADRSAEAPSQPTRRRWPDPSSSSSTLESGLRRAQPMLGRLAGQVNGTVKTP